jgi:threonine dehydratase
VTLEDIRRAQRAIADTIDRTALLEAPSLGREAGCRIWLKPENQQRTGSFKIRGAANRIAALDAAERARGIITASSGNHGRAVAYVAARLGARAVICVSRRVPANKIEGIRGYGAEVVIEGATYDEAERAAFRLQREQGLTWISAFDEPRVIAGQGTIGLELFEDLPDLTTAVVPLSGGGLISGIAVALKALRPTVRVIGVSMERAPMMYLSLRAGAPVEVPEEDTVADALVGSIGADNHYTFRICRALVDDVVLVSEQAILAAIDDARRELGLVLEGGGAVGLAALRRGTIAGLTGDVAVVLSGGNVDPAVLDRAAAR